MTADHHADGCTGGHVIEYATGSIEHTFSIKLGVCANCREIVQARIANPFGEDLAFPPV